MKENIRRPAWIRNQLDKIVTLIENGYNLDAVFNINDKNKIFAWSLILNSICLDDQYINLICFVHDYMDGKTNFVDQYGRTLLHYAATIISN